MVYGAAIAAIYVALTMSFSAISFGPVQFRISEALCILPFFTPAAIPGLFIGCFLSNLLCGAAVMDVVFGSIATLIGAVGSYCCLLYTSIREVTRSVNSSRRLFTGRFVEMMVPFFRFIRSLTR